MRKIEWEFWNLKEEEQLNLEDKNDIFDDNDNDNDNAADQEQQYFESYSMSPKNIVETIINNEIITTPFGIFSSYSPFLPSKRWSCWIGHTNFNIGVSEVNTIKKAPGVESLTVMGRYTFCIGIPNIGNLFDPTETKLYIAESLCGAEDIDTIKQTIGKHKYWAILIRPDGLFNCAYSRKNGSDYNKQLEKLEKLRKQHGGRIYSYTEYPELIS